MTKPQKTVQDCDTLLAPAELAELAGVSLATIRRLIWSGQLSATRIGRLVRIRLSDWQSYLDQHREQVRTPLVVLQAHSPAALRG